MESAVETASRRHILRLENVTRTYKTNADDVVAIKNISLTIYHREVVAIVGPSGSGKSTLLHLLGCLDVPSSGNIYIDDQKVNNMSDKKLSELRNRTIGFVFQSFYLQPFLSLKNNLAVPAMFSRKSPEEIDKRVTELLSKVSLADRASHLPSQLSGGQIQRAAIARALMNNPPIILADEPTGNLDTENSESIIDLFRQIRDDHGTTVVVVTHNLDIASRADRIITLKDGEIV